MTDNMNETINKICFFGRTIHDPKTGGVFFNWTGSGFELVFEGRRLNANLAAIDMVFPPEGTLWPWISVFVDDMETPARNIEINRHELTVTLVECETTQRHTVRVVKRSENDKGKVGLIALDMDGELLACEPRRNKYRMELIGDSISCGFGNEARTRDDPFLTAEENGLRAYGAVAAKVLDAECHNISISGIPLCRPADPDFKLMLPGFPELDIRIKAMEDYYEYTDRLHEEARGVTDGFARWDFSRFTPDAVVINLGTNDSYMLKAAADRAREERHFERRYLAFIRKVRELNGPHPVIACTLGAMDYFLYGNIVSAVEEYQSETGDDRIFCYKFGGIFPMTEGYGAGDHPSAKTHERMGEELGRVLKEWLR